MLWSDNKQTLFQFRLAAADDRKTCWKFWKLHLKNNVSATDTDKLIKWCDKQPMLLMEIYRDNILYFSIVRLWSYWKQRNRNWKYPYDDAADERQMYDGTDRDGFWDYPAVPEIISREGKIHSKRLVRGCKSKRFLTGTIQIENRLNRQLKVSIMKSYGFCLLLPGYFYWNLA